jgi:dihydroorotate dehydrogenase
MMYRLLFNLVLKWLEPELTHKLAVSLLHNIGHSSFTRRLTGTRFIPSIATMQVKFLGMEFKHPLGLAAGFDKDGRCVQGIEMLGFSFAEIGTITPQQQFGNQRPRLFRFPQDRALINWLGFPSLGVDAAESYLRSVNGPRNPLGISLGKNKETPHEKAFEDYCTVLKRLYNYGDFFVVNISSPNTAQLRELQNRRNLPYFLGPIIQTKQELQGSLPPKPLLLKISPDLTWEQLDDVLEVSMAAGISGIIATNTTIKRPKLTAQLSEQQKSTGGLSGSPLKSQSTEIIKYIYRHTGGNLPIVGVGGIFSGEDIWEKIQAGATLVQAYSGLVYEGPMFVKRAITQLQSKMITESINSLSQIVGAAANSE